MVILLLFNDYETLTAKDIQSHTEIALEDMKRNLQSLVRSNLLLKDPSSPKNKIEETDSFQINMNFKSKFHRVKINLGSVSKENVTQIAKTNKKITEDRKLAIQAAIVRIMKSRKTLTHTQLVNEVTRQLISRFPPDPVFIKRQIENLIERDYLERSSKNRKTYHYLA